MKCWVIEWRKFRVERIDRQHRIKTSVVESRKKQKTGGTYFQRRKLNADGPPSWFDRTIGNESVIMFWSNVSLVNNNSHQKKALKNAISLQKLLRKKNIYRLTPPSVISFRSPWNHKFDSNHEATAIADPPLAKLDIEKTCQKQDEICAFVTVCYIWIGILWIEFRRMLATSSTRSSAIRPGSCGSSFCCPRVLDDARLD